jgi:hypothetical protein
MSHSNSLTIGQNSYPVISIAEQDFIQLPVDEFIKLPPAPIQRNSHLRVSKMKTIFDQAYNAGQKSTLSEVAIGIVTKGFDDIDPITGQVIKSYVAGTVMIVDANTRKHYWIRYPQQAAQHINGLTAKIHYISSMEDLEFAYYPYNSKDSVEKTTEKLQGLARRYQWQPKQTMFANGNYKTAIDWATQGPGEDAPNVFESFNYCFEELKVLETIPKNGGNTVSKPMLRCLKSQPILAAYLIALKLYPGNLKLFDFIEQLSSISEQDLNTAIARGTVSPIEIIALEWSGLSSRRGMSVNQSWLNGIAGSTNFSSKEPQLDFLLYWIFEYIQNPAIKNDFKKGIRPTSWEGTWKELSNAE